MQSHAIDHFADVARRLASFCCLLTAVPVAARGHLEGHIDGLRNELADLHRQILAAAGADDLRRAALGDALGTAVKVCDGLIAWGQNWKDGGDRQGESAGWSGRLEAVLLRVVNLKNMSAQPSTPPAPQQPTQALTKPDEMVLLYLLDQHPVLRTQPDIEAGAALSRKTVGESLKRLMDARLVHRPKGERRGGGLTEAGKHLAERLKSAAGPAVR